KEKLRMPYFLGGTLVPAVITSAPILSVTSDPNDMDIETFRVPHEKAHYQDKEWLVYEFPLPLELQLESRDFFTTVGESRYAKMHIFIVNGKHVKRFFECLGEAIKTRSKKSYRALAVEYQEFYKGKK
ncbi:MAG: hypothetical protein OEY22_10970, partial [Candidatus Bathyarchaeota archaeon]|nr:hypothetical protein [Candidatus Bathyarchaeota archaeon]